MRLRHALAVVWFDSFFVAAVLPCAARAIPCTGDCDGDGRVALEELIRGVDIALDRLPTSRCPSIDASGDGRLWIDELIAALRDSLRGCPRDPTPTPTLDAEPVFASAFPEANGLFVTWFGPPEGVECEVEWRPSGTEAWTSAATSSGRSKSISGLENGTTYELRVSYEAAGERRVESEVISAVPRDRGPCSQISYDFFRPISFFCGFDEISAYLAERNIAPEELRCRNEPVTAWDRDVPDCLYVSADEELLLKRSDDDVARYQPLMPLDRARALARRLIWGDFDPYSHPEAHPYEVIADDGYGIGNVTAAVRSEDFRISYGGVVGSRVSRFEPSTPAAGRYAIVHEGHANVRNDSARTIDWFLARGWTVIAMDMPLEGLNRADRSPPIYGHSDLWRLDDGVSSPVGLLLLPVKAVLDLIEEEAGARRVVLMIGRSGGGWTTFMSGALDPRIDIAVPVAGGIPDSQRLLGRPGTSSIGDYEQFEPHLFDIVGFENLMAAAGAHAAFFAYASHDPCCFRLKRSDPFLDYLRAASVALAKPIAISVDQESTMHGLSRAQLEELDRFLDEQVARLEGERGGR